MSTIQLNALSGIRNDVASERFETGDLLSGRNIDIDETGSIFRRLGTQRLSAGVTSSLWSDGENAFYVRSSTLYRLNPDMTATALTTGVASSVAYETINDITFWSDGTRSGRIVGRECLSWGIQPPAASFSLSATAGDLPAGTYGVTVVYLRDGLESAAKRGVYIELDANSGISISNLPVSTDASVLWKRIYITRPDGEVFFAASELPNSATSTTVTGMWSDELPLRTQFKSPAPAGQIVKYYAGRAYVAQGNVLWYSDPYEYELFDLRTNFIAFNSPITILAPVDDGMYLATEKETVFLAGREPSEFDRNKQVLSHGGVSGTLVYPRNDVILKEGVQGTAALWMSRKGVVLGSTGGQLLSLTGGRYTQADATSGAGLFKFRSGTPQYVTTLFK